LVEEEVEDQMTEGATDLMDQVVVGVEEGLMVVVEAPTVAEEEDPTEEIEGVVMGEIEEGSMETQEIS